MFLIINLKFILYKNSINNRKKLLLMMCGGLGENIVCNVRVSVFYNFVFF